VPRTQIKKKRLGERGKREGKNQEKKAPRQCTFKEKPLARKGKGRRRGLIPKKAKWSEGAGNAEDPVRVGWGQKSHSKGKGGIGTGSNTIKKEKKKRGGPVNEALVAQKCGDGLGKSEKK